MKSYDDGTTTGTYDYDENHRKATETVNYGSFSLPNTYAYYGNGLKKTYTGPDSVPYGYTYDTNNQLTGVSIPGQGMITISAYNWTRPASMTLPGGATKSYVYDPLMRVKQITSKDPGGNALVDYNYTYDKMDNITAKNTEHGGYGYQYDDLYRLKDVENPAAAADEAFTYDGVGNRLTAADTTGNWTYNPSNELTFTPPSSSGSTGGSSYEYDVNGNMTKKSVDGSETSYVYNTEDRLTEVWSGEVGSGSLIATYYYDPFGRRIWKEVSGVRTNFHYADEGLVGEYGAGGVEIKTYGYKPGSTWTTDPLFMKVGSEYFFYHNDHLGTPQNMISVNGAVVWSAKYSSFGKATVVVETVENNLRFAGQYYDVETALHYNWNRYYSAQNGRYNRKDPSGLASGNLNWHVYASNNPIAIYDFTGLSDYSIRDGEPNPALEWQCPKGMKRSPRKDFQYGELDGCSVPPWAVKWKGWVDKDFPRGRKKARFKTACDMHDICYRSANPAINVIGERKNCDDKFLKNLEQECQSKVGLTKADREQCLKDAKSYYWGVRFGGWDAYKVNQKRACEECKPF